MVVKGYKAITIFAQAPCRGEVDIQNIAPCGKVLLNCLLRDNLCYSSNKQTVTSAEVTVTISGRCCNRLRLPDWTGTSDFYLYHERRRAVRSKASFHATRLEDAKTRGNLSKKQTGVHHLDNFPVDIVLGLLYRRQEFAFTCIREESIAFAFAAGVLGQVQVCYRSKFGKVQT